MIRPIIFSCVLVFGACIEDNPPIPHDLPACVEEITLDTTASLELLAVQAQYVKGELHYWLTTDARHLDGPEYIVNMACDTVCVICGFCDRQRCIRNYDNDDWEIIWERD